MRNDERPIADIAVFYEHPSWFEPLFAEFDRRGVAYLQLEASSHRFDPSERTSPYRLLLNRMSPSAFTRGHAQAIPYTLHYLAHLEEIGTPVIGGYRAYQYEFSKARQLGLLAALGVRHPRTRVFNDPAQAVAAADGLEFPLIVKPNVGGSGAGIVRFDTLPALRRAAESGGLELGLDHTGLLQEYHPPRGGSITRVEVLGGELLYAIRLRLESPDAFNLCPADYCKPGEAAAGRTVEAVTPPPEMVAAVKRLTRAAGIEVGGVEYLESERDGKRYVYDINALSNFVADAPKVVGFDPFARLVEFVLARAGLVAA